ncbi:MAG: cytochrome c3 family protein [Thermoanaerobaculia bacterium]
MRRLAFLAAAALLAARPAAAQLGELVSPGPLSRAHAKLEGLGNCEKCHEKGKQVAASRCLACHRDVAARVAQKKGVHRDVKGECAACHAEHAGRDAELRPFETRGFDHARETGFPLDGRHAPLAEKCAACHRTRSFLKLSPTCVTCHADVHKGTLGTACAACHSAAVPFKETVNSFDHAKTRFALTGAHAKVACAKCHANGVFRGVKFASCADCHRDPHAKAFGADCSSCHETATFRTTKVDHAKTSFPLRGRHAALACAACHREPATKVKLAAATCAACHQDPHRGQFRQDCAGCHDEKAFRGAPFDHAAKTRFPLTGKHAAARCASCHAPTAAGGKAGAASGTAKGKGNGASGAAKANGPPSVVDFRGLKADCTACHKDPHRGSLGATCATCHGTESFHPKEFRHPRFPELFAGAHENLACEKCHGGPKTGPNGRPVPVGERTYRGLSTACASCHKDPHLGQVGTSCESCHSVTGAKFAPVGFDHAKSAFPLTGKHAPLACEKCHRKETGAFPAGSGTAVRLKGLGTACASCHKDPHLGQLGTTCTTCHSPESFKVPAFTHPGSPDFWKGGHAQVPCAACHKSETAAFPAGKGTAVRYKGFASSCALCHKDPHRGALGSSCEGCHSPSAAWKTASREFHKTSWPLEGKHLLVPCASCHVKGQTKGTPRLCADCHWYRRQDDRFRTQLGLDCQNCHRPQSWTAVTWDHAAATGFPLSGAHATIDCAKCHTDGVFRKGAVSGCASCHRADYERAKSPDHVAGGFPMTCETCHKVSDASWRTARIDHQAVFPLVGRHATAACADCHRSGVYRGTPRDCAGCHLTQYQKATNPSHVLAGFPTTCETCHKATDAAFTGVTFAHLKWPLVGRHAGNACTACHRSGVYAGLPSNCASCHQADYQKAVNPNHAAAGFPTTCETCHALADPSWQQGKFDHASVFALVGRHATAACADCHRSGVFRGTSRDCAGCHLPDFQKATNPNHLMAGFATTCETCHKATDTAWTGATWAHTKWPLVGRHAGNACSTCHRSGVYAGLPSNCASCHQADYQKTANPNHAAAGFPTTCETCHALADPSWQQGKFDHASAFALVGRHATAACADCHKSGVYRGTARDCAGCHLADFQKATNPNHLMAGFATTCETCHKATDTAFAQGTYAHTRWPLLGQHASQACTTCHRSGVFAGLPSTCASCHLADYQKTTNPNHAAAGFPTTCETCHKVSDAAWSQGTFNHATVFALVGVHATQPCAACHKNGVYAGTPRDCAGCHLAQYQAATNPNHLMAGFATTCETCHRATDTSFAQGTYAHTKWPLLGLHASQACTTCHRNGVFAGLPSTCASCHLADYQKTTNPNHAAVGFPTTCETCHRVSDTSWLQGTFNHATVFALVGVHATQPCAACHKNGVYAGTPRDCGSCHLSQYQAATNPNHAAAGFATTCETCHKATGTSFAQGTYAHTKWPLLGLHASQSCTTCHRSNVYAGLPSACASCHLSLYQATTNPNHTAAGFPTTCETCHKASDTSWLQGTFNHTWFPITSGRHAGNPCSACHTSSSNYAVFTCLTCHGRTETDGHHRGIAGYRYDSVACYSCHPQGRAG